ncbi:hypothetical protein RAD15_33440 [Bradyrhizobium sp. 14AA]
MTPRIAAPAARFGAAVPALKAGEVGSFEASEVQRTTDFPAQIVTSAALQSERSKSPV